MPKGKVRNKDGLFQIDNGHLPFNLPAALSRLKAFGEGLFEERVIHGAVTIVRDEVGTLVEGEIAMLARSGDNLGLHLPAGTQQQGRQENGQLEAVLLRETEHADRSVQQDLIATVKIALNGVHELIEFDELEELLVTARNVPKDRQLHPNAAVQQGLRQGDIIALEQPHGLGRIKAGQDMVFGQIGVERPRNLFRLGRILARNLGDQLVFGHGMDMVGL